MKITFKENNACFTCKNNGDININPKTISKFGYIEGIDMVAKDFVLDGKGIKNSIGLTIEIPKDSEGEPKSYCPKCNKHYLFHTGKEGNWICPKKDSEGG